MLGGVAVPAEYRVIAHSDGDVVLHAICDALLGAVAAGDLGEYFPDNDEQYKGCDSSELLKTVLSLPDLTHYAIVNIDINIVAQTPRLAGYKRAMREHLATLLGIKLTDVSIKARTHEQVDAIGEKRAIGAQAVVLLKENHQS